MSSGYSGTPLAKKLGFKSGYHVCLVNEPSYYRDLFTDWPENIYLHTNNRQAKPYDIVHLFVQSMEDLLNLLPEYKNRIRKDGMIWVSWPKKASKVPTDVTEDAIRNLALEVGLVDVKVCAIDEIWSGLKLVFRLKDR